MSEKSNAEKAVKRLAPTPALSEITVSYSVGVKANLGNYESGDCHLSRTEKWDVRGMDEQAASEFANTRYSVLKEELDSQVEKEYKELKGVSV